MRRTVIDHPSRRARESLDLLPPRDEPRVPRHVRLSVVLSMDVATPTARHAAAVVVRLARELRRKGAGVDVAIAAAPERSERLNRPARAPKRLIAVEDLRRPAG